MTGRQLFVVTGASGGFGSAILRQINAMHGEEAVIIACARNKSKLEEVTSGFSAQVKHISVDFGQRQGIKARCQAIFDLCAGESFDSVYLYNNHGLTGDVSKLVRDFDDCAEIEEIININM